jgi:hypothetical protein
MRPILSIIMILCLLHTQSYHAAYRCVDTVATPSPPSFLQRGLEKVKLWTSSASKQSTNLNQLEAGVEIATPSLLPSFLDITTSLKEQTTTLKQHFFAFINTPLGFTATFLTGTLLVFYSLYLFVVGFSGWLDEIPFSVSSKRFTHLFLSEYQPLDVCMNFLANKKDLKRTRSFSHYDHASGYNGIPFEEALPIWLNNAQNLVSMLSTLVLTKRSVGLSYTPESNEFYVHFAKFIYTHAASLKKDYVCTFELGKDDFLDAFTGCQEDFQKYTSYDSPFQISESADAAIQFRRWDIKRELMRPSDVASRLHFQQNNRNTQKYPQLDYSPNPTPFDTIAATSMQRHLMQLNNPLSLSDAVKDRVENNLQIMMQLNTMLHKLRLWEKVSEADVLALSTLVRSVFIANQIALTSDVGCDLDLVNGMFKLLSCFEGSSSNIPVGAPVPNDAQAWFVPDTSNGVRHVVAVAKKAPITEVISTWLTQSTAVMHNLWGVANSLHHHICNATSEGQIDALRENPPKLG